MNHSQIEKNNMYDKMSLFFKNETYKVTWATFDRLRIEIDSFNSHKSSLSTFIQQHLTATSGVTTTKNNAFYLMVEECVRISQKAVIWANDSGNPVLVALFDVQTSSFSRDAENKAYTKVKNIRDGLAANIGNMGSVLLDDGDVVELNKTIADYEKTLGTVGQVQTHKTVGTQGITEEQKQLDKSLGIIDNLLVSHFQKSHPEMVKEYLLSRVVEKLPTFHSGISVTVTDAATGVEIEGAILTLNGKTSTTDIDGYAEIIKIRPGTYNISVTSSDYTNYSQKVTIERSKVLELEAKLVKG